MVSGPTDAVTIATFVLAPGLAAGLLAAALGVGGCLIFIGFVAGATSWACCAKCCARRSTASSSKRLMMIDRSAQTDVAADASAARVTHPHRVRTRKVYHLVNRETVHLSTNCHHVRDKAVTSRDVCLDCLKFQG